MLPQVSQIHPSTVLFPKKVKVTKEMRFVQHCVAAASQLLTPQQTSALKDAEMQRIFAGLRAPVHLNFPSSMPRSHCCRRVAQFLQTVGATTRSLYPYGSVQGWYIMATWTFALASRWRGSLCLPCWCRETEITFLVDCKQCQYPLVTVVAATADSPGLQLGTLPQWGHSCWRIRGGHHDF